MSINSEWQSLEREIVHCRACPRLVEWRELVAVQRRRAYLNWLYWGKPVPGFGDQQARILVVGLAPGAHGSNRTGRMFTGDRSGDFLYRALFQQGFASQPVSYNLDDGLRLTDVFISAVCRCAPPANKPTSQEISACLRFLEHELSLLEGLKGIVALGHIAFDYVKRIVYGSEPRAGDKFQHGKVYTFANGKPWLVASYHPSQQNTQTGRLTEQMFADVWEKARRLVDTD